MWFYGNDYENEICDQCFGFFVLMGFVCYVGCVEDEGVGKGVGIFCNVQV